MSLCDMALQLGLMGSDLGLFCFQPFQFRINVASKDEVAHSGCAIDSRDGEIYYKA